MLYSKFLSNGWNNTAQAKFCREPAKCNIHFVTFRPVTHICWMETPVLGSHKCDADFWQNVCTADFVKLDSLIHRLFVLLTDNLEKRLHKKVKQNEELFISGNIISVNNCKVGKWMSQLPRLYFSRDLPIKLSSEVHSIEIALMCCLLSWLQHVPKTLYVHFGWFVF